MSADKKAKGPSMVRMLASAALLLLLSDAHSQQLPVLRENFTKPNPCESPRQNENLQATYYIDAQTGADKNDGSISAPWKTVAKALKARAPAVILVRSGSYGVLSELTPVDRRGPLLIRAATGATPQLAGINISYREKAAAQLRIEGFKIMPDHLNGGTVVSLSRVKDVEIANNEIKAAKYASASGRPGFPRAFDGIKVAETERIEIRRNKISSVFRGIQISDSSDIGVRCNYISPQSGSGIQYLANNRGVLIDSNHIRGGQFVPYPADPDAFKDPHASVISIRSGYVDIRNNILHGMGSTSAIRFYDPDVTGGLAAYSNIKIEGNLIYDIAHDQVLQLKNYAQNVLVRNNLVVSRFRSGPCSDGVTPDARYRYGTALNASPAAGLDGSGLSVHNNIFVGIASFPPTAIEGNNIIWSYTSDGKRFESSSPGGTSKVVTSRHMGCGTHSNYFESGFFAGRVIFAPDHHEQLHLVPTRSSGVSRFGNRSTQLESLLGHLDDEGIFVIPGGNRNATQNSAGPYEP